MSKTEMIHTVAVRTGTSRRLVAEIVESFFECLAGALRAKGRVTLGGFGAFRVRGRKARPGRNPRTGEPMLIGPSRTVSFRPSKGLRKAIS